MPSSLQSPDRPFSRNPKLSIDPRVLEIKYLPELGIDLKVLETKYLLEVGIGLKVLETKYLLEAGIPKHGDFRHPTPGLPENGLSSTSSCISDGFDEEYSCHHCMTD